jgi:hypothetical protein
MATANILFFLGFLVLNCARLSVRNFANALNPVFAEATGHCKSEKCNQISAEACQLSSHHLPSNRLTLKIPRKNKRREQVIRITCCNSTHTVRLTYILSENIPEITHYLLHCRIMWCYHKQLYVLINTIHLSIKLTIKSNQEHSFYSDNTVSDNIHMITCFQKHFVLEIYKL